MWTVALLGSAAVMSYTGLLALVYFQQQRLVYRPARALIANPEGLGLYYEPVWLTASDGVRLHGWYVPASNAPYTVLYLHGNGGNISYNLAPLAHFAQLGFAVLSVDYRGDGLSAGTPSEQGTYRDAVACWRYLVDTLGVPPECLVFYGRSLGAAVAAWLACHHPPALVILESAFTALADVAEIRFRYLPARRMTRYEYPTLRHVRTLRSPVLILHSRADDVIPYAHGLRLYQAANTAKRFLDTAGLHTACLFDHSAAQLAAFDAALWELLNHDQNH